jgi:hypothetical protein
MHFRVRQHGVSSLDGLASAFASMFPAGTTLEAVPAANAEALKSEALGLVSLTVLLPLSTSEA